MKQAKSIHVRDNIHTHHIVFLVFLGILFLLNIILAIIEAFRTKKIPDDKNKKK